MKKLTEKKWFWPVAVVATVLVIVLILFFCGFRITYAPKLENSWEAISACAGWAGVLASVVGVVASFVAIWYAVQVPKRIADRQDKIALFEKRYECYTAIQNLLVCADQIKAAEKQTNKAVQVAFRVYLGQPDTITENLDFATLVVRLVQKEAILVSGEFLFERYNTELLLKIIDTGVSLITSVVSKDPENAEEVLSDTAKEYRDKFCDLCTQFDNEYSKQIEKELQIS